MALYTQAEFSRFIGCSRAAVSKAVRDNKLKISESGIIDSEIPENKFWMEKVSLKKGNEKAAHEKPAQTKPVTEKKQKPVTEKKPPKKTITKKQLEELTDQLMPETLPTPPENEQKTEKKKETLAEQKMKLEIANLREKLEKAKLDNQKTRATLVEIDTLGQAIFGYLIALNKNILSMPKSFVDEFAAGQKAGKSKTELTDILVKPISAAIIDARDQIKKEQERHKRAAKQNNERSEPEND
jgi:hypothetical protein